MKSAKLSVDITPKQRAFLNKLHHGTQKPLIQRLLDSLIVLEEKHGLRAVYALLASDNILSEEQDGDDLRSNSVDQ